MGTRLGQVWGARLKDVGWQGAGHVYRGLGARMETLVVTLVTQTAEKARRGALVPGAETWSLSAPVKWLHRACPVHSASPRPTAHGELWEGDSPPRNLLVSVTLCVCFSSLQRQMLTALLMACWCFPPSALPSCPAPFVPSAPGSRCLCSNDTRLAPGLVSASCRKPTCSPLPPGSRVLGRAGTVGEELIHSHLCSFPVLPLFLSWSLCRNPNDSGSPW